MQDTRKALVLFSGGQDSTTCLAWALDRYAESGISTDKFHARAPVRLEGRTSMKWVVLGQAEVRG